MKYPSPFRAWCQKVLPAVYDDSLSYYEVLCKLMAKINEIIDALDIRDAEVDSLLNWFNNLDVTAEVNAKLDSMAESGELERIIGNYLQAGVMYSFDTVADMLASHELINGSIARTLGYYTINDGGDAIYKIVTMTVDYVIDGYSVFNMGRDNLVAILISADGNIKRFGAKDDVTYDSTPNIQAAVDYNHTVVIPDGNFYMGGVVNIPYATNARRIVGLGMGASGPNIHIGPNARFNVVADSTWFSGIRFVGATTDDYNGQNCIIAQGQNLVDTDLHIENCVFSYIENAVTVNGRGCEVRDCLFVHCPRCIKYNYTTTGTGLTGDSVAGARALQVINNRFHSVANIGGVDNGAVYIPAGATVYNPQIVNNLLDAGNGHLVMSYGSIYGGVIASNVCGICTTHTLAFNGPVDGLAITGNSFSNENARVSLGYPAAIVRFDGATKNVAVTANYFKGSGRFGIVFGGTVGAAGCSVNSNVFSDVCRDGASTDAVVWFAKGITRCSISNNIAINTPESIIYFSRGNTTNDKASHCVCLGNVHDDGVSFNVTWFPADTNTIQNY